MPLTKEVASCVSVLERLQNTLRKCDDPRMGVQCTNDLNTIISVLHNPVLSRMANIQDSMNALRSELAKHPSLLPSDFDINLKGDLILHLPAEDGEEDDEMESGGAENGSFVSEQVVPTPAKRITKEGLESQARSPPIELLLKMDDETSSSHHNSSFSWQENEDEETLKAAITSIASEEVPQDDSEDVGKLNEELMRAVLAAAQGRELHHIQLYKPEGTSLGFSVVGLKSEQRGDLGIYVQEIQSTGIAAEDGRLRDGDQILSIDGHVLDSFISHQQAISILQKANKLVDLIIARAPDAPSVDPSRPLLDNILNKVDQFTGPTIVPPSTESHTSNMLNTEWAQVEVIHLDNDGTGLGFGIIGGRSTGVVVKTILPGGVADREGRLQSGDHILQIGEVNLRGMGSDQVATVLRQAGSHVRLVVARPVESASPDYQLGRAAPILETRVLNDPDELDRHLNMISNGFPTSLPLPPMHLSSLNASSTSSSSTVPATNGHLDNYLNGDADTLLDNNQLASSTSTNAILAAQPSPSPTGSSGGRSSVVLHVPSLEQSELLQQLQPEEGSELAGGEDLQLEDLPEMETVDLQLQKDRHGLGVTIAGYVCEREELSGIFVKSINAGSAADRSGRIQVNDQIVEVDGQTLFGLSNHDAVKVLRSTGHVVALKLTRYLRGPKFEQLQQAIANSELKTTPTTPNPPRAPLGEIPSSDALRSALDELDSPTPDNSMENITEAFNPTVIAANERKQTPLHTSIITISDQSSNIKSSVSTNDNRLEDIELMIDTDYGGHLRSGVEKAIVRKWSKIVGNEMDIVVSQLSKFERGGGLGISLEGTVDVEDGREVRPHHYIRSILPDGPVGRDGKLRSGDELLEVNNQKLLGLNHVEVVTILKELPMDVRIVCGRRIQDASQQMQDKDESFNSKSVLGGSLQNLVPSSERLVKAKSDGSLSSSQPSSEISTFAKGKSRSLEPLTGLAMWSAEPQEIQLLKGDRGLGFSILDYQDPLNPTETVIVIRSLVPGGVAEKDGRLIPGDRLVAVNGTSLENASLDQAVAVLKGAARGTVSISVAKPISVLESPGQLDLILGDLGSSDGGSDLTDDAQTAKDDEDEDSEERRQIMLRRNTNDSVLSTTSSGPPSLPSTLPPIAGNNEVSVLGIHHNAERLIGGSSTSVSTDDDVKGKMHVASSGDEEENFERASKISSSTFPILPKNLLKSIRVRKGGDQLGINIEVFDHGSNGVIVSSLVRGGAVHKDGRLRAGDIITMVNNESMRNVTNSQARAILRRTQLVTTDISIVFIPGHEAARYREAVLQTYNQSSVQNQQQQQQVERAASRSPYNRGNSIEREPPPKPPVRSPTTCLASNTDIPRSVTAPSFVTRQIHSRDISYDELPETSVKDAGGVAPSQDRFEAPLSSSNVGGAAATVVTLKNAISEVLGTPDGRLTKQVIDSTCEEGPFTITFRNVTEAGGRVSQEEISEGQQHIESSGDESKQATPSPMMEGKHWGPERIVEVKRDHNNSLGISIVGGKVDLSWSGSSVTGIFVKNVLANSPAGRSGLLKTGDRILEVEGMDLRSASHEKAVEVIKKTGNPVTFVVQSLVQWTPINAQQMSRDGSRLGQTIPEAVSPARTPTPELIQPGLPDIERQQFQEQIKIAEVKTAAPALASVNATIADKQIKPPVSVDRNDEDSEEESDSDEDDTRFTQGSLITEKGEKIDRASAGAMALTTRDKDPDEADEFGYTNYKVQKRYSNLEGNVVLIDLEKGDEGLGLSLAGHRDRTQMAVFVCGLNPSGKAYKDGRIMVGDEVLEVNGNVIQGRSHLNASSIFKGIPGPSIKVIVRRTKNGQHDMAVRPITQFPITLQDETPEEKYGSYKGLTNFIMRKVHGGGLGIMIIEGKHAEYGQGIFISDLQDESVAAQAGLQVGDMILCVNKEEMIGIDYETAANILKRTEGIINMWVANPTRVAGLSSGANSASISVQGSPARCPSSPGAKPEIPPKPTVPPKPSISVKPATAISKSISTNHTTTITPIFTSTALTTSTTMLHQNYNKISTKISSVVTSGTEDNQGDPSSSEIKPGKETTIEIVKEKMGLGLSIVGGSDTLLGAIIIHEVYPDGAAAKDGRLKPGDQILEVNTEDFRTVTHQKALSVLRQTPSKVKMVVYREEGSQKEEDMYDVINVQLTKKSGKGLGLSIVGRKNGPGVFISDLVPGGVAESDGRLMHGDQILDVNSTALRNASQEQAAAILKCAPASVNMKIGRLKPGKKVATNSSWPIIPGDGPTRNSTSAISLEPSFPPQPPLLLSPHSLPPPPPPAQTEPNPQAISANPANIRPVAAGPSSPGSPAVPPTLRTVILERGDDGLGFSIVGGFGSHLGDLPIYVKSVFERGAAMREGTLRRGDQILQANGHSLAGLSHAQAVAILKDSRGSVTLTVLPSK